MKIGVYCNLSRGGAENILLDLILELSKSHSVDFYSHYKKLPVKSKTVHYYPLKFLRKISTGKYLKYILFNEYLHLNKKLANNINHKGYDLFILGPDWITQTPLLSKFLDCFTIQIGTELKREYYEQTEWGFYNQIKQKIWKKITKKIKKWELESLRNVDKIIVHSIYSKAFYEKFLRCRNIKIIYPFINSIYLKENHSKKSDFLLSVGRPSFLKGYKFLTKALKSLPSTKKYDFKIVGQKGTHPNKILNFSKTDNIKFSFEQNISNEKLLSYYRQAKLFLYFPIKEPFGLAAIEALSQGCKTLGINEGGFTEIANQSKNCFLIPRNIKIFKKFFFKLLEKNSEKDTLFKEKIKNKLNVSNYCSEILMEIDQ